MLEKSYNQSIENELHIKDVINFFWDSWKLIASFSIFGILAGVGYLAIVPNQYAAQAQIQVAQIALINKNNQNSNVLGINVEEPGLLISRFRLPTTYSVTEINACFPEEIKNATEVLADLVKFSSVKGVGSVVQFNLRLNSKENAILCAQAIFERIRESQNEIVKPFIQEAESLLEKYQLRLKETQSLVSRVDRSGAALSAAYLANRDEVKFLTDEIVGLNAFIASANTRQAKLISPIYASELPIFPKKSLVLVLSVFCGFFLGILIAIMKRVLNP